jgi:nucleoside-diphosphate-sugar epimerase
MRILFTGASSFTGCHFVKELAAAGHELTLVFTRELEAYEGVRRARVEQAAALGDAVFGCRFGDPGFMTLVEARGGVDLLCHHAAEVSDYKSPGFDVVAALAKNTHNLAHVLEHLRTQGCRGVLLTGSVFENGEGAGSEGLPAFSPYGLSKALTATVFAHYCRAKGMQLGKFVISNPFGPYEEQRFTSYLVRTWVAGERATVQTPDYVRDNIHVSLLAKSYASFADRLEPGPGFSRSGPSGYVESQGRFAVRFAEAMRPRLGLACEVELKEQATFAEPRIRINTDVPDAAALGWSEREAWDDLADYYLATLARSAPEAVSRRGGR